MPVARGQGKTRSWLTKNQHELREKEVYPQRLSGRRRKNILHHVQTRKPTKVENLIYRFLGNLEALNSKQRHMKMRNYKVPGAKMRRQGKKGLNSARTRAQEKLSSISFEPSESTSKSIFESAGYNDSVSTEFESDRSRPTTVCSNASTFTYSEPPVPMESKHGMKELLKRKSLIEIINNYIKVGIEADERKAKRYISKALSFGVNSGYLVSLDKTGHLFEVSSALPGIKSNVSKDVINDRKRRKVVRHGLVNFNDSDVKSAKKRTSSRAKSEKRRKESSTNASRKRVRSNTNTFRSPLKDVENKIKKSVSKKKAKISRQARSRQRGTRSSARNRRSPTPWRNPQLSAAEEKNEESSLVEATNDDCNNKIENKEHNTENKRSEDYQKLKSIPNSIRKDDAKIHNKESNTRSNATLLSSEIPRPIENADQGDKQS